MPRRCQNARMLSEFTFCALALAVLISGGGVAAQSCTTLSATNPRHPIGCSGIITQFCDEGDDLSFITAAWLRNNGSRAFCPTLLTGRQYNTDNFCRFLIGCSATADCNRIDRFPSNQRKLCGSSCDRCWGGPDSCPLALLPYTSVFDGAGCLELDPVGGGTPSAIEDPMRLYIGVGVGVGVLFILVVIIIIVYAARRRRQARTMASALTMLSNNDAPLYKADKRDSVVTATMVGQPTAQPQQPQQYPYPSNQPQPQPQQQYPYPVQQPMQQQPMQPQGQYPQQVGYDPQMGYSAAGAGVPPPVMMATPAPVAPAPAPAPAPAESESSSSSESDSEKSEKANHDEPLTENEFTGVLIEKMRQNPTLGSRYIDYNELEFERQLGKGNFGAVFYGNWNGRPVAIKKSNMVVASKKDIEDIIREAELMMSFPSHPNVLSVLGISYHNSDFFIISEYCAEGSLDKHFGKGDLTFERKMRLIHEIALGVAHIHKYGIVHRDLAARNVLLDADFRGKVCDFGMSRQLTAQDDSLKTQSVVGPLKYMAPESLAKRIFSTASDVWTFGVVCSEILNETTPHNGVDLMTAALKIRDECLTPTLPPETPDYVLELCGHCWAPDPEKRPSMQEVVDVFGREIGVM